MILSPLAWLAAALSLLAAYPWACWLQHKLAMQGFLTGVLLTTSLSLGAIAWLMTLLAAASPDLVQPAPVLAAVGFFHAAGWALWWPQRERAPKAASPDRAWLRTPVTVTALLVIFVLVGLTLFNAAYWPFFEDDTMSLYGPMAVNFVRSGEFGRLGLYDAYPQLVPLVFSFLRLTSGLYHEYTMRLVIAVLSLGTIGGAYLLGKALVDRRVGLTAAFLTATVTILPHWAASGYTDLPAGAYYVLTCLFAWRLYRDGRLLDAIMTGIMAGLAALTKNGALLLPASLAGWVVYSYWARWRGGTDRSISLRNILLMAAAWLVVAGPWYAHTWQQFGYLVPPTGWTEQAGHTLGVLFGPATALSHFVISGPLGIAGLGLMLWALWHSRPAFAPQPVMLIGFGVPFWLVWWWYFSYDLRFLLLVWPLFAVMGAHLSVTLYDRLPAMPSRWLLRILPLALVLVALPAARMAVDHKGDIVRAPLMNDDARHRVQLGPRYDVVLWAQQHTAGESSIVVDDYRLIYYLLQSHGQADHFPTTNEDDVTRWDYWIVGPDTALPAWTTSGTRLLYETGGYRLLEIVKDEAN